MQCVDADPSRQGYFYWLPRLFGHAKDAILTSADFNEKIYIRNPIISSCQLSPLRSVSNDISKVRFLYFKQTELEMHRTSRLSRKIYVRRI